MVSKKNKILEVICPACAQVHKVPEDRFRTDLSRASMQCARCQTMFSLSEQGTKPRAVYRGPSIKVLAAVLVGILLLGGAMVYVYWAKTTGNDAGLEALPEPVKIALLGGDDDTPSPKDDLQGLTLSVTEGYKLVIRDKNSVLVVKGKVKNPGIDARTRVLLEGRIVDPNGAVRFVTRAPCGRVIPDKRLRKTRRGAFSKLFTRKKEFRDCTLKPGQEKPFQMIFDDIPKDYDEAYTVQVKTLFAGRERVGGSADSE